MKEEMWKFSAISKETGWNVDEIYEEAPTDYQEKIRWKMLTSNESNLVALKADSFVTRIGLGFHSPSPTILIS